MRRLTSCSWGLWIGWMVVIGVPPALADTDTLGRLLDDAMANNPAIAAAGHRWEAAKAEVPRAGALEDPELSVTQWSIPSDFNLTEADETWYGVSQALPFPGKRALRTRIAELGARAAEQEYAATVRGLRARIKTIGARLYRVQRTIAVHLEHQTLLEDLIRAALIRYEHGEAAQQESLKAQGELFSLHTTLIGLQQERRSLGLELNALVGRPDDPEFSETIDIAFTPLSIEAEALSTHAEDERPELRAAGHTVVQRERAVALARRAFQPDFGAELTYWDVHAGPNRWMLMGKMNVPWVWTGKYRAEIARERAELARARAEQQAVRNETRFLVRDLFFRVKTAERLVELYRGGIAAQAEQSLESARIAYSAGRTDVVDVIESERRLRDVRLEADLALADWAERRAELERVVGRDF